MLKTEKYRELAEKQMRLVRDLANRYKEPLAKSARLAFMLRYWLRCSELSFATILLVEHGMVGAAMALEKSVFDAVLKGLHIGYVVSDVDLEKEIAKAAKGRGTGYSSMKKLATEIDKEFEKQKPFMSVPMFTYGVQKTSEMLNEFGHGGLLSTLMSSLKTTLPDEVGNGVMAKASFLCHLFLSKVFLMENFPLDPLVQMQAEFGNPVVPVQSF